MIRVYADDALVYDSRLDEYRLLALAYTAGVSISGTASFTMAPNHPAFNSFVAYRTVVTIYRDEELLFRGRTLTPRDDLYNCRTITCEGERGFFLDSIVEPYLFQDSPASILTALVEGHNAQTDSFKGFQVGEITVTDANDYVRLESSKAEKTSAVIDKLLGRCGGYLIFTTNAEGQRVVNWYASIGYQTNQSIEFGKNLTDYTREDAQTQPITVLYPYGAVDKETGVPITIESVNNGVKYIEDAEAVALRGRIVDVAYWDDVTEPLNLLRKSQALLEERKNIITSLHLTAVDLSAMDKSLAAFRPGDLVPVISKPHGVDESFLLMEKSEDLLSATVGYIDLGKEKSSLTGLGVAGDKQSASELQRTEYMLRADYALNIANTIASTERVLASLIEQTESSIRSEVSETYVTDEEVASKISTELEQTNESWNFTFNELKTTVDENDETARKHIEEQVKYIRFEDGNIILGKNEKDSMTLTLENDLIVFKKNGSTFGWWDGVDFHTGNIVVEVNERAQFGNFAFVPRSNGSLSFLKVGG